MTSEYPGGAAASRDPTRSNVILLSFSLALSMSGSSLVLATSPLVAQSIALDKSLATLPLALQWVATMTATVPASLLMRRFGRRSIFIAGQLIGMSGAALATYAVFAQSFWLFAVAGLIFGTHNAIWQYYRFAAADTASEAFKSRAISFVLAGGVIAAVIGPELAKWSRDLFSPVMFAGGFTAMMGLSAVTILLLTRVDIPVPRAAERASSGRDLSVIARQPAFVVAVLAAMIGYTIMTFVMTATPLAMVSYGHIFDDAAWVIQWHILGMYAPSFFTGHLIKRFGEARMIFAGALLMLLCIAVNMSGTGVWHFWAGLVLLGLGWNFLFVGGTTLLTSTHAPEEKAKVQALNDFLVFSMVSTAALASGWVEHSFGWGAVNLAGVAPILFILAALIWLMMMRRREPAAQW